MPIKAKTCMPNINNVRQCTATNPFSNVINIIIGSVGNEWNANCSVNGKQIKSHGPKSLFQYINAQRMLLVFPKRTNYNTAVLSRTVEYASKNISLVECVFWRCVGSIRQAPPTEQRTKHKIRTLAIVLVENNIIHWCVLLLLNRVSTAHATEYHTQ